jgi:predicted protein tyrosine phosphatase
VSAASAWAAKTVTDALGLDRSDPTHFLIVRLALARLRDDEATAARLRAALEAMRKSAER